MKVAAYQAPLLPGGSMEALELIRARVKWCETILVAEIHARGREGMKDERGSCRQVVRSA
jgi:hypothetical protein